RFPGKVQIHFEWRGPREQVARRKASANQARSPRRLSSGELPEREAARLPLWQFTKLGEVPVMGWQSDWLYQLIFEEVEKVWKRAKEEGVGQFGPPPSAFRISEMSDGIWEQVQCRGDARRRWLYQGGDPEPGVDGTDVGEQRGMFYERGIVEFFIDG